MNRFNKNEKPDKKINSQNIRKGYEIVMLFVVLAMVLGFVYLRIFAHRSWGELFEEIICNLIGIFSGFLVFEILLEKLTKDSYEVEVSEKIIEALTGDAKVMKLFSPEQRRDFAISSMESLVEDEDISDIATTAIKRYVENSNWMKLRKSFSYEINLSETVSKSWQSLGVSNKEHFFVYEDLDYKIKYLSEEVRDIRTGDLSIAFMFENANVDENFRVKNCVFSENLNLSQEVVDEIIDKNKTQEDAKRFVESTLACSLKIDDKQLSITNVNICDAGVIITYNCDIESSSLTRDVSIKFAMPMKWGSLIYVIIRDMTYSPKIRFRYDVDTMDVDMIPYLDMNEKTKTNNALAKESGVYDINMVNEWIYPVSGTVFKVNKLE